MAAARLHMYTLIELRGVRLGRIRDPGSAAVDELPSRALEGADIKRY